MHIRQTLFFNLLFNVTGKSPREIKLVENGIAIGKGKKSFVSFSEIANAPVIKQGFFYSKLQLPLHDASPIIMRANSQIIKTFADAMKKNWQTFHLHKFKQESSNFNKDLKKIDGLLKSSYYPAACRVQVTLEEVCNFCNSFLEKFPIDILDSENKKNCTHIISFAKNPKEIKENAVKNFINNELAKWNEFFATIESMPLTPEQRLAVITDEDATLVLAGAGSGKTSVITAKAGYLVKAKIRKPQEILVLAFAKDAANEMSKRIKEKCRTKIQANTFHSFAYNIIANVEGSKPALANHASDERAFLELIKEILVYLIKTLKHIARLIGEWFAYFFIMPKTEWEFKTKHAYYKHLEQYELRTLQGEQVKSYEELIIANWLYQNGIEYEYEPLYEHALQKTGKREYTPDFKLMKSGIYIEHFGVRRRILKNGEQQLYTAPFVNRKKYLEDMEWKRNVHKENQTILIETYSFERQEGRLLDALEEKLKPHVTFNPQAVETIYDKIIQFGEVDNFSRMIATFLRKFKSGGYTISQCRQKANELNFGKRAEVFLNIFEPLYEAYQQRLGNRIDFEDMVLRATNYVESGKYQSPYKHVLIDEFQDISKGQARLIKALKAQNNDTRIFAVGDDWQSIYRFAGSDIHYMHEFAKEFGGKYGGEENVHKIIDLGRTFRSVDKIALAAKHFILKNPKQLTKKVITNRTASEPAIQIIRTQDKSGHNELEKLLEKISTSVQEKQSVLLLGRYRHVAPRNLGSLQRKFSNLIISYKTIHASKGLEADHVIILQLNSGKFGFPSETVDNPMLAIVSPQSDSFENAEERRVMYVAMTRAKHTLTMLMPNENVSSFANEIIEDPIYEAKPQGVLVGNQTHECLECGGHLVPKKMRSGTIRFQCEHKKLCGNSLPTCHECQLDLPLRKPNESHATCLCKNQFSICPECQSGWLIERTSKYGKFLGCVRFPKCAGKAKIK